MHENVGGILIKALIHLKMLELRRGIGALRDI